MLRKLLLSATAIIFSSLLACAASSMAYASEAGTEAAASDTVSSFNAQQQKDITTVVHQYLIAHPEVLMEVVQQLRKKQMDVKQQGATKKITENMSKLIHSHSPKAGNPQGNVYLVEFFDYQCGHCRNMDNIVKSITDNNKNVQLVYKNFAVLGPNSQLAARIALAANMQGKYSEIHEMLMKSPTLTQESMLQTAKDLGLDIKKLQADMNSDKVNQELQSTQNLAKIIGIYGTPAFIVTAQAPGKTAKIFFIPGEVTKEKLEDTIKQAAQTAS